MTTTYTRLTETRSPRRSLRIIAGRPIAADDAAYAERQTFLDRERRKHDSAALLHRFDWRALFATLWEIGFVLGCIGLVLVVGRLSGVGA